MALFDQRWPSAHVQGWNTYAVPGLFTMAVLALVVWLAVNVLGAPLLFPPATYRGRVPTPRELSPACAELGRLRSHGAAGGTWYRQVHRACARSTAP